MVDKWEFSFLIHCHIDTQMWKYASIIHVFTYKALSHRLDDSGNKINENK